MIKEALKLSFFRPWKPREPIMDISTGSSDFMPYKPFFNSFPSCLKPQANYISSINISITGEWTVIAK